MELAGRKVLVTGAGGFIGSHLVEALAPRGCSVRCLIRYTSRSSRGWIDAFPREIVSRLEIVAGDLKDPEAVRGVVRGCEVVFHLGALIGVPYSYIHPRDYVDTNVIGTTNVITASREFDVARLVHVSTSEVYGTARYTPIDEAHPKVGQSPYSASKIAADMMVEAFQRSFGLPAVTIRPFNTYGPRQSLRAVIPTIGAQLLKGTRLRLGNLKPTRDFTYVADTVAGLIRGAEVDEAVGETINLGSGEETSIGRLVELVSELIGVQAQIESDSERLRPMASEVQRLVSDNSKARSLLGWRPETQLRDGLRQTLDWLQQNLTGLRDKEYIT